MNYYKSTIEMLDSSHFYPFLFFLFLFKNIMICNEMIPTNGFRMPQG